LRHMTKDRPYYTKQSKNSRWVLFSWIFLYRVIFNR
jgi:hypothetical protein